LSQPKLVPTLLLGGQGYMCVNNLPKVVTRYASVGDRTRDLPVHKHIWVTTLTFHGHVTSSVTCPFGSQVAISYRCFIGTSPYLQPFSGYCALSIWGSRPNWLQANCPDFFTKDQWHRRRNRVGRVEQVLHGFWGV